MAKNVFICVDGGTKNRASSVGFEKSIAELTAQVTTPLCSLKSVNPSSTAPAHASAFSGKSPVEHGILGNFYNVADAAQESYDPVKWIHPYTHGSTSGDTILDDLESSGLSWAAVNMPQTVEIPVAGRDSKFSPYVLYAPEGTCILKRDYKTRVGEIKLFDRSISILCDENFNWVQFSTTCETVRRDIYDEPFFIIIQDSDSFLCFWIQLENTDDQVTVRHSKAGIICGIPVNDQWGQILENLPPVVEKTSRFRELGETYTECPIEEWVTEMAIYLDKNAELDALWVRYNAVDHAQETLLFRESEIPQDEAERKVIEVYSRTLEEIGRLVSAQEDMDNLVIFSDHGIARITQLISIPDVLSDIFGPSHNVKVTYSDTRLLALRHTESPNVSIEDIRFSCERLGLQLQLPMSHEERSAGWDMIFWARNDCEFSESSRTDNKAKSWAGHGGDCKDPDLHGLLLTASNVSNEGFTDVKDIRDLRRVWRQALGIRPTGSES
ncbi:alkaline phosphatase family protein [Corynebacterium striatum]